MKNKYWVSGGVGIVLIVLIAWFFSNQKPKPTPSETVNTEITGQPAASSTDQTATSTPPAAKKTGSSNNLAYNQALAIYQKNGYRIQFSECRAIPSSLAIRQGVKYMLDNRDSVAHTIKVGTSTYNLPGYGYMIVTAYNLGINNVSCSGGGMNTVNTAQINIQK